MKEDDEHYVLCEWVPYDGMQELFSGTRQEVKEYINRNRKHLPKDTDDLVVYVEGPDIKEFL